jgi:hypothetical protein
MPAIRSISSDDDADNEEIASLRHHHAALAEENDRLRAELKTARHALRVCCGVLRPYDPKNSNGR